MDQLLANELVDKAAIIAIKRQFRDLTSLAKWDSDEDRQLDARQVRALPPVRTHLTPCEPAARARSAHGSGGA